MRTSTEIQIDLDAAVAARRVAMTAQSYSMDSGQGKQQVQRASLKDLNELVKDLTAELEQAQASESGDAGLVAGEFVRY